MGKRWLGAGVLVALAFAASAQVLAQENPNRLIGQRKAAMELQAKYLGQLAAMAKGRAAFDAQIAQRNADYIAVLTQMPWDDFQQSTAGSERTRAKPELYKDPAKFKSRIDNLHGEVQKLVTAAHGGSADAVKAAAFSVARACNACHEDFATFDFRFPTE
jgi:cytochrome c556